MYRGLEFFVINNTSVKDDDLNYNYGVLKAEIKNNLELKLKPNYKYI